MTRGRLRALGIPVGGGGETGTGSARPSGREILGLGDVELDVAPTIEPTIGETRTLLEAVGMGDLDVPIGAQGPLAPRADRLFARDIQEPSLEDDAFLQLLLQGTGRPGRAPLSTGVGRRGL